MHHSRHKRTSVVTLFKDTPSSRIAAIHARDQHPHTSTIHARIWFLKQMHFLTGDTRNGSGFGVNW